MREGAARYPQNVNISAAAALAGIGLDRTRLVIVVDPALRRHVVEIEAEGAFGRFSFAEEVEPTADNPKTGTLVAMAVIKTLRQLAEPGGRRRLIQRRTLANEFETRATRRSSAATWRR